MKQRKFRKLNNQQAWMIVISVIGIAVFAVLIGLIVHGTIIVNQYS